MIYEVYSSLTLEEMNLVNFIGKGKEQATSRKELSHLMSLNDREVRRMIQVIRDKGVVIISDPQGGYYIPRLEEADEVRKFAKREHSRYISIAKHEQAIQKWLKNYNLQRLEFDD